MGDRIVINDGWNNYAADSAEELLFQIYQTEKDARRYSVGSFQDFETFQEWLDAHADEANVAPNWSTESGHETVLQGMLNPQPDTDATIVINPLTGEPVQPEPRFHEGRDYSLHVPDMLKDPVGAFAAGSMAAGTGALGYVGYRLIRDRAAARTQAAEQAADAADWATDPRSQMAAQLLMRGHGTEDEIMEAAFGHWPPNGPDIAFQNTQTVTFGNIADRIEIPGEIKAGADATLHGDARIRMPEEALNGTVTRWSHSALTHENTHILQGGNIDSYGVARGQRAYGNERAAQAVESFQMVHGETDIVAKVFLTHTDKSITSLFDDEQKKLFDYLNSGVETQARIVEALADGYQEWGVMPLNREEFLVAMQQSGLHVPDAIMAELETSPMIERTRATFSREKRAARFPSSATDFIDDLNFMQSGLSPEGQAALWNEAMPAVYADFLEQIGDGPGRARFGLGPNPRPALRAIADIPDQEILGYMRNAVDLDEWRTGTRSQDIFTPEARLKYATHLVERMQAGESFDAIVEETVKQSEQAQRLMRHYVGTSEVSRTHGISVWDVAKENPHQQTIANHAMAVAEDLFVNYSPKQIDSLLEGLEERQGALGETTYARAQEAALRYDALQAAGQITDPDMTKDVYLQQTIFSQIEEDVRITAKMQLGPMPIKASPQRVPDIEMPRMPEKPAPSMREETQQRQVGELVGYVRSQLNQTGGDIPEMGRIGLIGAISDSEDKALKIHAQAEHIFRELSAKYPSDQIDTLIGVLEQNIETTGALIASEVMASGAVEAEDMARLALSEINKHIHEAAEYKLGVVHVRPTATTASLADASADVAQIAKGAKAARFAGAVAPVLTGAGLAATIYANSTLEAHASTMHASGDITNGFYNDYSALMGRNRTLMEASAADPSFAAVAHMVLTERKVAKEFGALSNQHMLPQELHETFNPAMFSGKSIRGALSDAVLEHVVKGGIEVPDTLAPLTKVTAAYDAARSARDGKNVEQWLASPEVVYFQELKGDWPHQFDALLSSNPEAARDIVALMPEDILKDMVVAVAQTDLEHTPEVIADLAGAQQRLAEASESLADMGGMGKRIARKGAGRVAGSGAYISAKAHKGEAIRDMQQALAELDDNPEVLRDFAASYFTRDMQSEPHIAAVEAELIRDASSVASAQHTSRRTIVAPTGIAQESLDKALEAGRVVVGDASDELLETVAGDIGLATSGIAMQKNQQAQGAVGPV